MSIRVVVDSNVLVALVDNRDKWHLKTKEIYSALEAKDVGFVYFDCVINEAISVLARRSEEQRRSEEFPILLDELQRQVPTGKIT